MIFRLCMLCCAAALVAAEPIVARAEPGYLVRDGEARAVLVSPARPAPPIRLAIDELQAHLHRACGVKLPVVAERDAAALPADVVRVVIGCNDLAKQAGIDVEALHVDEFRIKTAGNVLVFAGHDSRTPPGINVGDWNAATLWAVDHFLDVHLGVRWLWPGEVGTHVPKCRDVKLPTIDHVGRPSLETRYLRCTFPGGTEDGVPSILTDSERDRFREEAYAWMRRSQLGSRSTRKVGHAFTTWWKKYGATHPEYFAVPPVGSADRQPWPGVKSVKLRLGNEAVDDAIIAEWQAAGAPDDWNVSPNDGVGFDTSAESRAMDVPPGQDPELIWRTPEADLTARYVKFWNRLILKMRQINPNVRLTSYAYSAYRDPPPDGLKLEPGIVLDCVPTYWAQDDWRRWSDAGATLVLRPNWWHSGVAAPVIPLHREGEFLKFALLHGLRGLRHDSLHGFWGTRGAQYYLTVRLLMRPELTVDDVVAEYCSAFGAAAPQVQAYLNYWEAFTERAAYSVAAGGEVKQPTSGLYEQVLKEHGLGSHPLVGSWTAIPLLYDDQLIGGGYAILDQARAAAEGDDAFVQKRIEFLRAGLDHLTLVRDVLRLGYVKRRNAEQEAEYLALSGELQRKRHAWTLEHVVWGENANRYEAARGVAPTFPVSNTKQEDLRGK